MYNRYIPQSDGTYCRKRYRDNIPQKKPQPQTPPYCPIEPNIEPPCQQTEPPHAAYPTESVTGFLRRLLPKGFDTGDLMIILLLLLISGDSAEEQSTALLTLAIYLFM